jgi:hypothetical protein
MNILKSYRDKFIQNKKTILNIALYLVVFVLVFNVHFTKDSWSAIFQNNHFLIPNIINLNHFEKIYFKYISPLKAFSTLICLIFLFSIVIREIRNHLKSKPEIKVSVITKEALFFMAILFLFALPIGPKSLGMGFATMSIDPFSINSYMGSKKFLMPVIAFFLQFRGMLLFYAFSLMINFLFIFFLLVWFYENNIIIPKYYLLSIFLCSFVFYNFQIPSYSDALLLLLILFITVITDNISVKSLIVLSFITHEAGFIIIFVVLLLKRNKEFMYFFLYSIITYYLVHWLSKLTGAGSFLNYDQKYIKDSIDLITQNPLHYIISIVLSYKLLWVLIIVVLWQAKAKLNTVMPILLFLMCGLFISLIGLDSSRLFGFSFLALLYSVKYYYENNDIRKLLVKIIVIVNIILPSAYYALNIEKPYIPYGLYSIYTVLTNLFNYKL